MTNELQLISIGSSHSFYHCCKGMPAGMRRTGMISYIVFCNDRVCYPHTLARQDRPRHRQAAAGGRYRPHGGIVAKEVNMYLLSVPNDARDNLPEGQPLCSTVMPSRMLCSPGVPAIFARELTSASISFWFSRWAFFSRSSSVVSRPLFSAKAFFPAARRRLN